MNVLKTAQAQASTIEAVTSLVSPRAAKTERVGFAVLGVDDQPVGASSAALAP